MPRILHVDDEQEWIDLVGRALRDYVVDAARNYDLALSLIQNSDPYDLALIDLNLIDGHINGEEILAVLQQKSPSTRRVVITAMLPPGGLRDMFERYGLEDVIIKGRATLPGLRKVVDRALAHVDNSVPSHIKADTSELMERYRDWHDNTENLIRGHLKDAQVREWHGAKADSRPKNAPRGTPQQWQAVRDRMTSACAEFEASVGSLKSAEAVSSAAARLRTLMSEIENAISQVR
jgi:response regulator RpfG family c-di-GMP phosphodiesterase